MNLLFFAAALITTNLPTVVVEASRASKEPMEIAGHVETIGASEIASSGYKNLPQLLSTKSGLFVMNLGAGNPALAQVTARGYGENGFGRLQIVVDGERLNQPDMTMPNLARIPVSGIEQVEIMYGPETVLHGDAASSGVINIITDSTDYRKRSYVEAHGGSWDTVGFATGTRGGFEDEAIGYFADFDYNHSDGYRHNSGFDIYNVQGGLRKDFENGSFLRMSSFFSDADYGLPGPLSLYNSKYDPKKSNYDSDHGRLAYYGVNFAGKGVINEESELDFIFSFSERRSHFVSGDYTDIYGTRNFYDRDYRSKIYGLRFSPQYVLSYDILGRENELILGSETRYEILNGNAEDWYSAYGFGSSEKYDISRLTGGVFARDEFCLFDWLSLALGARLERAWNDNNVAEDGGRNDNLSAFDTSLNYRPISDAKVFLRWCRFYRNPFIDEYRFRDYKKSETSKPERGWDVEFGGAWEIENEYFLKGVAYYSEINREIHYNPFAMSNENSPWLHRRTGIDLSFGWERDKIASACIRWSGVLSTKAQGKFDGNWVPGVPRQQLNIDARLWLWDEFFINGGLRLIGSRYAISDTPNANGRIGADIIFRVGCQYEPTWKLLKGFHFGFSCVNLFNREYCDYVVASVSSFQNAYYPAAGRSYMFTIRYEF